MRVLRGWLVLALVATAWAGDAWVSVTCGHTWLSVAVPTSVLGSHVASGDLALGWGCGVTTADRDGYRLQHPLVGCGTTLELLPDTIHYSNVLHYRPSPGGLVARASPFSLPVDCYYPRMGSVSSGALQPTWVPFGSTIAHRRRLSFTLDVYDSSWSSRRRQPLTYSLGELINVEASVGTHPPLPLRVFVDECVATPRAAPGLRYQIITDKGCLLDGQHGRSRFLPQRGEGSLRFQLDTFLFPNATGSQIHLRCHLRAVPQGAGGTLGKACSYDPVTSSWHSLDGANCSCCGSPRGCRGRQRRGVADTGELLGEANVLLGPLGLVSALPSSSQGFLAPMEPTTPMAPTTSSPPPPSVPVVQGEKRDPGPSPPIPGTTLAMVTMSSILAAVGMAACYCSLRRRRGPGDTEAAPGGSHGVAMATTAAGGGQETPRDTPTPAIV